MVEGSRIRVQGSGASGFQGSGVHRPSGMVESSTTRVAPGAGELGGGGGGCWEFGFRVSGLGSRV